MVPFLFVLFPIFFCIIKLLCKFVNFEEMKKEIYKMILKKDNEKL